VYSTSASGAASRVIKGPGSLEQSTVVFMVDQSLHVLTLFALALLIG
jgi:hypothetical protein